MSFAIKLSVMVDMFTVTDRWKELFWSRCVSDVKSLGDLLVLCMCLWSELWSEEMYGLS